MLPSISSYNPKDPYNFPIERLANYSSELLKIYFASAKKYEAKYEFQDARYRVFHEVVAMANTLIVFSRLIDEYTESKTWFDKQKFRENVFENYEIKDINMTLRTFLKFGHFHAIFMFVEDVLRTIQMNFSPNACNKGKAEYKSIYEHMLTALTLKKYIEL